MKFHKTTSLRKVVIGISMLVVSIFFISCDEGSKPDYLSEPAPNVENLLESGWQLYNDGSYNDAYAKFLQASERDASIPQVYLGLGYASFQLGDLEDAVSNFQKTIAYSIFDSANADLLQNGSNAGLALSYLALERYDMAISFASDLIKADPVFKFAYDSTVTVEDVFLARALSSFHLNDFETAYFDVLNVDSGADFASVASMETDTSVTISGSSVNTGNGTAQFSISGKNIITVESVELNNATPERSYEVVDFVQGGAAATIFGNPLPLASQTLTVAYMNAPDYGMFLDQLMNEIVRLREENH